MLAAASLTVLALAASAAAQSAIIVIEASHGGAGSDLTNTTIRVPLGQTPYTDPALDVVSTLYLTGASGADVHGITCTPYKGSDGTGTGGLPFTYGKPSMLSTNTVSVGSIVCTTSGSVISVTTSPTGPTPTPPPQNITTTPVIITTTTTSAPPPPPPNNVTVVIGTPSVTTTYTTTITDANGNPGPTTVTTVVPGGTPGGDITTTTPGSGPTTTPGMPLQNTNAAAPRAIGWSILGAAVFGALGFAL